jgi:hypothetical protein
MTTFQLTVAGLTFGGLGGIALTVSSWNLTKRLPEWNFPSRREGQWAKWLMRAGSFLLILGFAFQLWAFLQAPGVTTSCAKLTSTGEGRPC